MPTPEQILAGLQLIADQAKLFAIGWHVIVLVAAIGTVFGWRPPRWTVGAAPVLPILSVAAMARTSDLFHGPDRSALSEQTCLLCLRKAENTRFRRRKWYITTIIRPCSL